jgi:putative transposase
LDSKTKTKIVIEGQSGKPISEICNEYGIHQNQFYTWRDKFLSGAHKAFDSKKDIGEVSRLRKKKSGTKRNNRLAGAARFST